MQKKFELNNVQFECTQENAGRIAKFIKQFAEIPEDKIMLLVKKQEADPNFIHKLLSKLPNAIKFGFI